MNGNKLISLLIVTGLVAGASLFVMNQMSPAAPLTKSSGYQAESGRPSSIAPSGTAPTTTTPPVTTERMYTVEMRGSGFIPPSLTIKQGDSVTFVSQGTTPVWPASGVHPTHLLCPGFDALKGIEPGQSYTYKFTEAKECPFHDHLAPENKGKITIIP